MASDSAKTHHTPGETVQKLGIYRVVHQDHRLPHEVSFRAEETFPTSTKCGRRVRFELVLPADGERSAKKQGRRD